MTLLDGLPVWGLALAIFCLRILDVTVGTMRTISVVQGRIAFSVVLGFCETLIWVSVISQVLQHATQNPFLLLAYAGGFATGNAVGIMLERHLALGNVILRIVTATPDEKLEELLRPRAARVFTLDGHADKERMRLLYVVVRRREAARLIQQAQEIDPDLFFAVDPLRETNAFLPTSLQGTNGWRTEMKAK